MSRPLLVLLALMLPALALGAPGDARFPSGFGITLEREHLVMRPGEALALRVTTAPRMAELPREIPMTLRAEGSGEVLERERLRPDPGAGEHPVRLQSPDTEGVYMLTFGEPANPYLRHVQFVVVGDEPLAHGASEGRLLQTVDLGAPLGPEILRSDGADRVVTDSRYGRYRVSGPAAERSYGKPRPRRTLNWFAVRMHTPAPLTPHWLEVDIPNDQDRAFLVSVLDDTGGWNYRNTTEYVVTSDPHDPRAVRTARLLVWPRSRDFGVLFANAEPGGGAAVRELRLATAPADARAPTPPLAAQCTQLGAFFEEPIWFRTMGGPQATDPEQRGKSWTDWRSFLVATRNLLHAMDAHGYDRLLLPVYTYGSSLYPSRHIASRDRYDSGGNFSDGRDPVQKDVVRLLLRLFEREGKTLVPILMFYTHAPALEAGHDAACTPYDLIDRTGTRFRAHAPGGFAAPIYDPLHPEVQGWVKDVYREFVIRYGESPALGDVGLVLNTTSWVVYPGADWGFGAPINQLFLAEEGLDGPTAPEPFARWLKAEDLEDRWHAWRNARLKAWYDEIGAIVAGSGSGRKLQTVPLNIFSGRHGENQPSGPEPSQEDAERYLRDLGLGALVSMPPAHVKLPQPLRLPVAGNPRSVRQSWASRSDAAQRLFPPERRDGLVVFHNYFESYLHDARKALWWPAGIKLVGQQYEAEQLPTADRPWEACYDGGWQFPQYPQHEGDAPP